MQQQFWGEVVDFNLAFFQFIWECNSENITKIGPYLAKLLQEKFGTVFLAHPVVCICMLLFSHLVLCFSVTAYYADWLCIMCRTCASVIQQPAGRAVRSEDKRTVFQPNYVIVCACFNFQTGTNYYFTINTSTIIIIIVLVYVVSLSPVQKYSIVAASCFLGVLRVR